MEEQSEKSSERSGVSGRSDSSQETPKANNTLHCPTPKSRVMKPLKKRPSNDIAGTIAEYFKNKQTRASTVESSQEKNRDEDECFLLSWASTLRELSRFKKTELKMKITALMLEYTPQEGPEKGKENYLSTPSTSQVNSSHENASQQYSGVLQERSMPVNSFGKSTGLPENQSFLSLMNEDPDYTYL